MKTFLNRIRSFFRRMIEVIIRIFKAILSKLICFCQWIWKMIKKFFAFLCSVKKSLVVVLIISIAWLGFLKLFHEPPIEEIPLLIMIWGSVIVLLFATFPDAFKSLRKLKFMDFEIELRDAIENSISQEEFTNFDIKILPLIEKGDYETLVDSVRNILNNQVKAINLVVARQGISIFMLTAYLYFLDLAQARVNVIFTHKNKSTHTIPVSNIRGVINGRNALRILQKNYPEEFLEIQKTFHTHEPKIPGSLSDEPDDLILGALNRLKGTRESYKETLDASRSKFLPENLFRNSWNVKKVPKDFKFKDLRVLLQSLLDEDEYLLVTENENVIAVIPLCDYTSDLTKKLLMKEISKLQV